MLKNINLSLSSGHRIDTRREYSTSMMREYFACVRDAYCYIDEIDDVEFLRGR